MYFLGRGRKFWAIDDIPSSAVVYKESEFYDFIDLISSQVRCGMINAEIILEINRSYEEALILLEDEGLTEGASYDL